MPQSPSELEILLAKTRLAESLNMTIQELYIATNEVCPEIKNLLTEKFPRNARTAIIIAGSVYLTLIEEQMKSQSPLHPLEFAKQFLDSLYKEIYPLLFTEIEDEDK